LKEAYIKALGIGLGFDLKRAEFQQENWSFDSKRLSSIVETTTKLSVDGILQDRWRFEQHYLDEKHPVAVALGPLDSKPQLQLEDPKPFQFLSATELFGTMH
jgi:4'-phosphopantetheinyl transferase